MRKSHKIPRWIRASKANKLQTLDNKVFEPKIDIEEQTGSFSETIINKVVGYKMKWEYIEQNFIPKKQLM